VDGRNLSLENEMLPYWFVQVELVSSFNDCFVVVTWQASFIGAMAIADLVKSTLGPKGMVCDFLLWSTRFTQHVASDIISVEFVPDAGI